MEQSEIQEWNTFGPGQKEGDKFLDTIRNLGVTISTANETSYFRT